MTSSVTEARTCDLSVFFMFPYIFETKIVKKNLHFENFYEVNVHNHRNSARISIHLCNRFYCSS